MGSLIWLLIVGASIWIVVGATSIGVMRRFLIAAVLILVVAGATSGVPAWREARARWARQTLLNVLQPVALENCELARFGSAYDGGYILCANLFANFKVGYSYGIGPNDDWGCDLATRYQVPVHQYDCFDPARPSCPTGQTIFHNECIGAQATTIDGRTFDTLAQQLATHGNQGVIVKMDVEGAEWASLAATPDAVLDRIDQLPMEMHGYDAAMILPVVEKLKRTFYVVNLHFNNNACDEEAAPLPARAYQVLLVNKRLAVLSGRPATPSPLNAPDVPALPECQGTPPIR